MPDSMLSKFDDPNWLKNAKKEARKNPKPKAPKKKKDTDKPIWVIDAETDPFLAGRVPKPFIWGLYTGNDYYEFDTAKQLAEFIRPHEVIIYAHNGGKFDYHYMLEEINTEEPITIIVGRLAKFKIGLAEMRDSYNIIPVPLATYKKDEIDYSIFEENERNKPHNMRAIKKYLKLDCIYLYELVTRFIETYGHHLTQASAAMAAWEKLTRLEAPDYGADYYEKFSPYYYGGRVQCFRFGPIFENFQVADINSAYPRAMLDEHPFSYYFDVVYSLPEKYDTCMIRLRAVAKGCFPYRQDSKLYFPADDIEREYTITGHELRAAFETGTVRDVKIIEVHVFRETINFKQYITHFYDLRQEAKKIGDKATDIFAKLLMNSLYGKWAANPQNYREYVVSRWGEERQFEDKGFTFGGMLGPWAIGEKPIPEYRERYYNITTAASITGWVRAYLWRAICASDGVLYCDTDSIAAARCGVEFGGLLGQWKNEGSFTEAHIAGKKMYAFKGSDGEWKHATKGVRLKPEDVVKLARGEKLTFNPSVPTYSVKKALTKKSPDKVSGPVGTFTARNVKATAEDISKIPAVT